MGYGRKNIKNTNRAKILFCFIMRLDSNMFNFIKVISINTYFNSIHS